MTVKVTTAVFWVFPLLLWHAASEGAGARRWIRERLVAGVYLVAIPFAAGAAWVVHSDHIKNAHATTRPLTSSNLRTFNFGRFGDRFDLDRWRLILERAGELMIGSHYVWLGLILVALWSARRNTFWVGMALTAFVTPLVFFNLYYVHEYYLAAISPAVAALLGLSAQWVWDHTPRPIPRSAAVATLAVLWLAFVFVPSREYVRLPYESVGRDPTLAAAQEIRGLPNGLVIVTGTGLNPSALYHAHRRGLNLYRETQTDEVINTLPGPYRYLYAFDPGAKIVDRVLAQSADPERIGPHTWALR